MDELRRAFGLEGYTALVTGASAGLGVEMADALAGAGANVVLVARRAERLTAVADEIRRKHGVTALAIAADLGLAAERERAFATAESRFSGIDILVNNAGIAPTGRAEAQWPDEWQRALDLNLTAAFHCSLLARPLMRRGGRHGRILNVSSIFGHLGSSLFRLAAYTASKGALENLTRQLAVEWARESITVNAIAPAWFPSEMTAGSIEKASIVEKMGGGCPMNRMGRPEEIRSACLFLAGPGASYVTGSVVCVDGGYSAW
jgi:gluconate 5-dehydrogenase